MTAIIEAHDLTKRFGKTTALDGLDLVAESGQVVAILARTAQGRQRSSGPWRPCAPGRRVAAGGRPRRDAGPHAVRRLIGLAGQYAAVEPAMFGRENLEMVARLFGQDKRAWSTTAKPPTTT